MFRKQIRREREELLKQFEICTTNIDLENYDVKYEQNDCAICLNEFINEAELRVINSCGHIFHNFCIQEYFK